MQEQGTPKDLGNGEIAENVQGEFAYTSPEGQQFVVTYVADENGFRPQVIKKKKK